MSIKILVCYHKKDVMVNQSEYLPIHVGKALNQDLDLGITTDSTGENISKKNQSFCELTGIYWAWKNLSNVDIIGLCHYRRFFDFHGLVHPMMESAIISPINIDRLDLSVPMDIIRRVSGGAVVIPKPIHYNCSILSDYCINHISDDFRVLASVIDESQPEYIKAAFRRFFYCNNKLSHYNMFLMRRVDFEKYCGWLFPILESVEERIDISAYSPVQRRIFGYMAERLLNVWISANNIEVIEKPIIKIDSFAEAQPSFFRRFSHKLRLFMFDLSIMLSKPFESRLGAI